MKAIRCTTALSLALVMAVPGAATLGTEEPVLEPLDVPDSSIRVSLPSGWDVKTGLDYTHFDWGDASVGHIGVFSAEGDDGAGCELRMYDLSRGGLDEHAEVVAADRRRSGATTEVMTVELAVGEARRIDVQDTDRGYASEYLWHYDPSSYLLTCRSAEPRPDDWADVAASLAWQAGSRQARAGADGGADLRKVEIPDFGVAISLPSEFEPDLEPVRYEMSLPPDGTEASPVTTILTAGTPGDAECGLEVFEGNPLTLEDHVAWVERVNLAQPGFRGSISYTEVSLPAGDGLRLDGHDERDGSWTTMYLFDDGDRRYQFYCVDMQRAADDYLGIAESIELLDEVPPWVPDDAVAWDVTEDFTVQVPVSHDETGGRMMMALCERAVWLEYADGTFEERMACELTDEPVVPAEDQGSRPEETVLFSGGPCEWPSDYWWLRDGTMYWAESWAMSVEPDGSVLGVGMYGSEPLECPAA